MSKEMPISDMEKILLEDPHIKSIHYDEAWDFPKIQYSIWEQKWRNIQKEGVETLKQHLGYPYIEDNFGSDHEARRVWAKEMEEEYSWFRKYHGTNSLRANFIFAILVTTKNLKIGYAGTNLEELKKLILKTKTDYPTGYNTLSTAEKVSYAKQLKQEVYNILKFLSEQSQAKPEV